MKLTTAQLLRIIKEEVQNSSPVTVEVDYDEFPDTTKIISMQQKLKGTPAKGLVKAVVVEDFRPDGGNPIIHLTFNSMHNAAAWWKASGYAEMDDIKSAIVQGDQGDQDDQDYQDD
jgi:hypothetical protein